MKDSDGWIIDSPDLETTRFTFAAYVRLGEPMQARQNAYFKSRDRADLVASKEAEKLFDAATKVLAAALREFASD